MLFDATQSMAKLGISPDAGNDVKRVGLAGDNFVDRLTPFRLGQANFLYVFARLKWPPLRPTLRRYVFTPNASDRSTPGLAQAVESSHLMVRRHVLPECQRRQVQECEGYRWLSTALAKAAGASVGGSRKIWLESPACALAVSADSSPVAIKPS